MREGIAHFSFEYPTNATMTDFSYDGNTEFRFKIEKSEGKYLNTYIISTTIGVCTPEIWLLDWPSEITDAEYIIDEILSKPDDTDLEDYQVLDRESIIISGITAEKASYSFSIPFGGPDMTVQLVIFNHNDLIWYMDTSYHQEVAEEGLDIFNHLIDTFRIPD